MRLGGLAAAIALATAPVCFASARALPAFQDLVDQTPTGAALRPAPGDYAGPVVIRRAIQIDGQGQVTISNGGTGTVVAIEASNVVLRGLHLTASGDNHDRLDAAVRVRGHQNTIADNRMDDVLFGVELQLSDQNVIRGNRITSKPLDMGVRGDGIRLWYSMRNEITHNEIIDVRDTVVWYSKDNTIAHNRTSGSRYALHFMYAESNRVEDNLYHDNLVGVFLMYSDGVAIRRNRISHSLGSTGMGIGFKESSEISVEDNAILYCATGIYVDISPYEPGSTNRFERNRIAYNGIGMLFHNDWTGNLLRDNRFEGNHTQVAVRGGGTAQRNVWSGNHWDDYRGFDRNGDGVGDTSYELYAYSDQLWMEFPGTQFFRGSPLLEMLDFLERLAPWSRPLLVLRDDAPILHSPGH